MHVNHFFLVPEVDAVWSSHSVSECEEDSCGSAPCYDSVCGVDSVGSDAGENFFVEYIVIGSSCCCFFNC